MIRSKSNFSISGDNGKIVYSITSGDEKGHFSIAPNGTITTRRNLDREEHAIYNLVVTATDQATPPQQKLSSTVQVSWTIITTSQQSKDSRQCSRWCISFARFFIHRRCYWSKRLQIHTCRYTSIIPQNPNQLSTRYHKDLARKNKRLTSHILSNTPHSSHTIVSEALEKNVNSEDWPDDEGEF